MAEPRVRAVVIDEPLRDALARSAAWRLGRPLQILVAVGAGVSLVLLGVTVAEGWMDSLDVGVLVTAVSLALIPVVEAGIRRERRTRLDAWPLGGEIRVTLDETSWLRETPNASERREHGRSGRPRALLGILWLRTRDSGLWTPLPSALLDAADVARVTRPPVPGLSSADSPRPSRGIPA